MSTPTIPPRPARAQNQSHPASNGSGIDVPKIPPRPKRSIDRSMSPNRDSFARSPLNDPSFQHNSHQRGSRLSVELPSRPPSVTLPSIGQEGSEYENLHDFQDSKPEQTKIVAGDLPLHAPTASLPSSAAKTRIQTVTRTDSSQAVAAGIGRLFPEDKSRDADSGRPESSSGRSRPQSIYREDEKHGIPEIGVQVPMYPNAGDVQAPTPSPYQQGISTGIGFFNKGEPQQVGRPTSSRHHGRTKSGREIFHGPPGSYGLHGHGVVPKDGFEQDWYAKHPEDFKREKQGEYGPHIKENRKDYHWEGNDLAKLVHQSASKGIGMGTSREAIGTPDEQIGYIAHEEYASRISSPRPSTGRPASISKGKTGEGHAETPLRHGSLPAELEKQNGPETGSEAGDDVIHIDPPAHRTGKIHGGGYDPPKEDLGPEGGNTEEEGGWVVERGYGVPILASDEVAKHPDAEYLQPAVSPELERHGSGEYTLNDPDSVPEYISGRRSKSRTANKKTGVRSRSGGASAQRFMSPDHDRSSTPLESMKEYEPLFPDDEDEKPKKTAVEKLKRPDHLARHHFPSEDIWEDTPSSLQLQTTVETPDIDDEPTTPPDVGPVKTFEKPEAEKGREQVTEEDRSNFLSDHTKRFAKTGFNRDVASDMSGRPGMQHRFPSQDIWEDAADHHHLVTTVTSPQTDETNEYSVDSPTVDNSQPTRPSIPARPAKAKETSAEEKKAPIIPERPKPQIPARPARPLTKSTEKVPTTSSLESHAEGQQPKAKPPVPARPAGSKIAALQAGFLQDLNSKLGLGPQAPKVKEPEPEKEAEPAEAKPLQDARKGRAKGPQRRKPASSSATETGAAATPQPPATQQLSFGGVSTIWSIDNAGALDVPAAKMADKIKAALHISKPSTAAAAVEDKPAEETSEEEPNSEKVHTPESDNAETTEAAKPDVEKETEKKESPAPESTGIFDTMKHAVEKMTAPMLGSPHKEDETETSDGKTQTETAAEPAKESAPVVAVKEESAPVVTEKENEHPGAKESTEVTPTASA